MTKISPKKALSMTAAQIEHAIFRGASPSEPRGFSDAFTDNAIVALADHETREDWPQSFRDWHFNAYFAACDRRDGTVS